MKKIFVLLTILSLTPLYSDAFQNGNIEFSNGNLEEAKKFYLEDLDNRGHSFNTLFNLGNLYIAQKEFGRALSLLRKAKEINPRDRELSKAISTIEEDLQIESSRGIFISKRESIYISLILLLTLSVVIFLINYLSYKDIKSILIKNRIKFIAPLVCLLLVSIFTTITKHVITNRATVLTTQDLLLSPYPGSKVVYQISEGIEVVPGEIFNDYINVKDLKDRHGWIKMDQIENLW